MGESFKGKTYKHQGRLHIFAQKPGKTNEGYLTLADILQSLRGVRLNLAFSASISWLAFSSSSVIGCQAFSSSPSMLTLNSPLHEAHFRGPSYAFSMRKNFISCPHPGHFMVDIAKVHRLGSLFAFLLLLPLNFLPYRFFTATAATPRAKTTSYSGAFSSVVGVG